MSENSLRKAETAMELYSEVLELMKGHGLAIQGATIAQLLAGFLAGHHPDTREGYLADHIAAVRRMIVIFDEQKRAEAARKAAN